MQPLQKTLWPNHYWNTSLQLLFLQKPKIFPAPACWPTNAELPLCHRKGNIGGCHYNRVVKVCFGESLALVSCAQDAFRFKNDWDYSGWAFGVKLAISIVVPLSVGAISQWKTWLPLYLSHPLMCKECLTIVSGQLSWPDTRQGKRVLNNWLPLVYP